MRLEALEVKTQWDEWLVLSGSQPIPLPPLHYPPPVPPTGSLTSGEGQRKSPMGRREIASLCPRSRKAAYSPDPSSGTRLMRVAVSLAPPLGPGRP